MIKLLQSQITWWISVLTIFVTIVTFLVGLSFRVQALEEQSLTFKDFINRHDKQQQADAILFSQMKTSLDLITGYFKLTPKDNK